MDGSGGSPSPQSYRDRKEEAARGVLEIDRMISDLILEVAAREKEIRELRTAQLVICRIHGIQHD